MVRMPHSWNFLNKIQAVNLVYLVMTLRPVFAKKWQMFSVRRPTSHVFKFNILGLPTSKKKKKRYSRSSWFWRTSTRFKSCIIQEPNVWNFVPWPNWKAYKIWEVCLYYWNSLKWIGISIAVALGFFARKYLCCAVGSTDKELLYWKKKQCLSL